MTNLIVENIAKEKTDVKDQILGINVIEVTIDDKKFEFPNADVIKSELDKAEEIKTSVDTSLIQLYYQIQMRYPIINQQTKKNITKMYTTLKDKYPNSIIDFNFKFLKNYKIRDAERLAILEIQKKCKISIFV